MAIKSNKYEKITDAGKKFIAYALSTMKFTGFKGSMGWAMTDGGIERDEIVSGDIKDHLNKTITTNEQYLNSIIHWYEQYGQQYNINPNILAAQGYKESTFRSYAYAKGTSAMGISQFLIPTIRDVIINNLRSEFTTSERNAITKNITPINGTTVSDMKNYYIVKDSGQNKNNSTTDEATLSSGNRLALYHNVVNNPQIMIKAQALLLNTIAQHHNNLAASALFLYYSGPYITYPNGNSSFTSNSFGDLFDKVLRKKRKNVDVYSPVVIDGGLEYVRGIFQFLSKDVGISNGKHSFGFEIDLNEIKGGDIVDTSKSHEIRINPIV